MSTPFKLKNKKDFDFGNKTDYSPKAIKGRKKYKDEGITYTRGSDEEQEVIRRQWGDDAGPPVREEDKK
jgi:hypothetical protein